MMAMTTSSSIRVKPREGGGKPGLLFKFFFIKISFYTEYDANVEIDCIG